MLCEVPSPANEDGLGEQPLIEIVCCEPPFALLKVAVIGWVTVAGTYGMVTLVVCPAETVSMYVPCVG
jgi:hypothetical protein